MYLEEHDVADEIQTQIAELLSTFDPEMKLLTRRKISSALLQQKKEVHAPSLVNHVRPICVISGR